MNEYERKRQERIERYRDHAESAERESEAAYSHARKMGQGIPLGQPILVGHHSEKRDRSYRDKIGRTYERGAEAHERAKYWEGRAIAAESNRAISSDDPEAIEKLQAQLEEAERLQELMREANKAMRKKDFGRLHELGFNDARITQLFTPDFAGRTGFAAYQLTNNSANIRRLKQRIAELQQRQSQESTSITIGEVEIVEDVEENRLRIYFHNKPCDTVRAELKSSGFRWSPTEGAWQRHLSNAALYHAKDIVTRYYGSNQSAGNTNLV